MVLLRQSVSWVKTSLSRVAPDRARHAVPATATATQFGTADSDDLDARLAQQRIRIGIPVIGDDDTGFECDNIVAIVPLLTFGLIGIAACFDRAQERHIERFSDDIE